MSIMRWESASYTWAEMVRRLADFSSGQLKDFAPAVDMYQTKDAVIVETPLASISPNDVKITIANDVLTIQGMTRKESEVDDKNYYRQEVRHGSFYRSLPLPAHVVGERAQATFTSGLLKIVIPKVTGHNQSHKIEILKT